MKCLSLFLIILGVSIVVVFGVFTLIEITIFSPGLPSAFAWQGVIMIYLTTNIILGVKRLILIRAQGMEIYKRKGE